MCPSLEEPWCPNCGIRTATPATPKKHEYLRALCSTNKYERIIDACAGSGKVQYPERLGDGSPIIIRKLTNGLCVFIEYDPKTFQLLTSFTPQQGSEFKQGDCNEYVLDYVDGAVPTLVFIDPNGYGIPAIRNDMVRKIASTKNTDVLLTFSWRVCREIGYARKYLRCNADHCEAPSQMNKEVISCEECTTRKVASSYEKSLNTWWGHSDWLLWKNLLAQDYAEKYAESLQENNTVEITPFAGGEAKQYKNDFYLILATKFKRPRYGIRAFF